MITVDQLISQLLNDVKKKFGGSPELDGYRALAYELHWRAYMLRKAYEGNWVSAYTLDKCAQYLGFRDFNAYQELYSNPAFGATHNANKDLVFIIDGKEYTESEVAKLSKEQPAANTESTINDFPIPDDVFDPQNRSISNYITTPFKEDVIKKGVKTYGELINFLLKKTGYPDEQNFRALLRVFNGYPYANDKIRCNGGSFRTFIYVIKFIFRNKQGRDTNPKYACFLKNVEWEPELNDVDSKWLGDGAAYGYSNNKCSQNIGNGNGKGTGVSDQDRLALNKIYPSIFPQYLINQ